MKQSIVDARKDAEAAECNAVAFLDQANKLERDVAVDISEIVNNDKTIALQKREISALEEQYLESEQNVFQLEKEIEVVQEGNDELLKICEGLMSKIEVAGN